MSPGSSNPCCLPGFFSPRAWKYWVLLAFAYCKRFLPEESGFACLLHLWPGVPQAPLSFRPPCLVSLELPPQKWVKIPSIPSSGPILLWWTVKSNQKVGGLQGKSIVILCMWMTQGLEKFSVCRENMEKHPCSAPFFPSVKLHEGRRCLWRFYLILSFGWYIRVYFKNLQGTPLMGGAQVQHVWFFSMLHLSPIVGRPPHRGARRYSRFQAGCLAHC